MTTSPRALSLAPVLRSTVDTSSEQFHQNRDDVLEQLAEMDELLDQAAAGGGPASIERMRSRGKLPIRERIANVLDPDSPFLEISPTAGYDSDYAMGGGLVVGIGVIADTHGTLRDEALTMLEDCGLILHLGDVGSRDYLSC